jgi:hypothetical protein
MSTAESLLAELLAASTWRRQDLLAQHGRTYGEGFATALRTKLEAELERRRMAER